MNTEKILLSVALILFGIGLMGMATTSEPTNIPILSYFNDKPKTEAWIGAILLGIGAFILISKNK